MKKDFNGQILTCGRKKKGNYRKKIKNSFRLILLKQKLMLTKNKNQKCIKERLQRYTKVYMWIKRTKKLKEFISNLTKKSVMEEYYGPAEIRTQDPRRVKAMS